MESEVIVHAQVRHTPHMNTNTEDTIFTLKIQSLLPCWQVQLCEYLGFCNPHLSGHMRRDCPTEPQTPARRPRASNAQRANTTGGRTQGRSKRRLGPLTPTPFFKHNGMRDEEGTGKRRKRFEGSYPRSAPRVVHGRRDNGARSGGKRSGGASGDRWRSVSVKSSKDWSFSTPPSKRPREDKGRRNNDKINSKKRRRRD